MPIIEAKSASLSQASDGWDGSAAYTHNWGSQRYAWGTTKLQLINENEDKSVVDTFISGYTQDGTHHPSTGDLGYKALVSGPNMTEITYYLHTYNCQARAVWETFFFS